MKALESLKNLIFGTPKIKETKEQEEDSLRLSCAWVARYWADILREGELSAEAKILAAQLSSVDAISEETINFFPGLLEVAIYEQVREVEYDPENPRSGCRSFDRFVGCYDYYPGGALRDVAEALSISPLWFPAKTGWYVNPGKVISRSGEEIKV